MAPLGPTAEWQDEARALRRFGMALALDSQWAGDERATAVLVETLIGRVLATGRGGDGPRGLTGRSRLLSLFVGLYRRHVRLRRIQDDGDDAGGERVCADRAGTMEPVVERAMRAMPIEMREALLLVALERLSHVEAAAALEIPLAALLERLERARAIFAQHLTPRSLGILQTPGRAPHLRVVK